MARDQHAGDLSMGVVRNSSAGSKGWVDQLYLSVAGIHVICRDQHAALCPDYDV